jgi:hypothetical protein
MNPLLVQLLLTVGGTLGESLVTNPKLQADIGVAVTATQSLIAAITGKTAVASAVFVTVLQAAFGVLQNEGKLTATEVAALNDAITKTLAADAQGQVTIDPTTIATPIAPLP